MRQSIQGLFRAPIGDRKGIAEPKEVFSLPKPDPRLLLDSFRYAGVGFQFLAEAGLLGGLGFWLDRKLGTSPWLLVIGAMTGVVYATWSLVRSLNRYEARKKAEESDGPANGKDTQ